MTSLLYLVSRRRFVSRDSLLQLIYYRPQQVISVNTDSHTPTWDVETCLSEKKTDEGRGLLCVDTYLLFH